MRIPFAPFCCVATTAKIPGPLCDHIHDLVASVEINPISMGQPFLAIRLASHSTGFANKILPINCGSQYLNETFFSEFGEVDHILFDPVYQAGRYATKD